ncbi:MAG TPA: CBS domain-containing protein [Ktedonobacteraceae bacterium]|nr:CBS domain-containing protein [Ktedonobacteraceae bacterium]
MIPLIFLSALLRQSIFDIENHRLGILKDIYVSLNETFPVVTALLIAPSNLSSSNNDLIVPWSQVDQLETEQVHVTVKQSRIAPYTPGSDELLLRRDLLDKQIVDTQGFRVVKVNDLKLAQIKGTARLVGADISFSGLLRRLGILTPIQWLGKIVPVRIDERTITWNYIEPIQVMRVGTSQLAPAVAGVGGAVGTAVAGGIVPQVQLNVSHTRLADLHPADIADILEQLNAEEAGAVLDRMDTETAADILSEVESARQTEILSGLDPERASDLLERLAPDDAADILAEIPQEEAERLLALMPVEESQPIRDLLRYGAETAGGIMTNEVLSLSQDLTVEEALAYLRQHSEHMEMVYNLYIVDDERRLVGVVSLRELVVAGPYTQLKSLMDRDVISVKVDDDQEDVARVIAKYDLLGVPVVDAENHLVGLVTVDDVIDVIHEEQAEDFSELAGASVEEFEEEEHFSLGAALSRVTWLGVNVLAGFALALLLNALLGPYLNAGAAHFQTSGLTAGLRSPTAMNGLVCLLPMLLLTSGSVGTQALGVAGWQLRSANGVDFWIGIYRELRLGTIGGILASIVVGLLTWLLFHSWLLGISIGLGLGLSLLIAAICGLALPALFRRLRLRGSLISAPLLDPLIAAISLSIFLVAALWLIDMLHV